MTMMDRSPLSGRPWNEVFAAADKAAPEQSQFLTWVSTQTRRETQEANAQELKQMIDLMMADHLLCALPKLPENLDQHKAAFASFAHWCGEQGVCSKPATGATLAAYLVWVSAQGLAFAQVKGVADSIILIHEIVDAPLDRAYVAAALKYIEESEAPPPAGKPN
jgi:hypothetical protein